MGWTVPGEWFNITIEVFKAGKYIADLLHTSNRDGTTVHILTGGNMNLAYLTFVPQHRSRAV
jgi:hypothetical protein